MNKFDLEQYINDYLDIHTFHDYCPNGLQIEGRNEIKKLITGVTACQELIDYAISVKADAILVHHGLFWKGDPQTIRDIRYKRISSIIKNDINLYAYHLPLDAHEIVGNNILLAKELGINFVTFCDKNEKHPLVLKGELPREVSLGDFIKRLDQKLFRNSFYVGDKDKIIKNVALCTGGAYDFLELAAKSGVDLFISGEIAERTVHEAKEYGIGYIAAGHHCTETFGVKKLGEVISKNFLLEVEFKNIPNLI